MSRLNSLTTLVSAGYPFWYSYGVSRGIIDVSNGLSQDLRCDMNYVPVSGTLEDEIREIEERTRQK